MTPGRSGGRLAFSPGGDLFVLTEVMSMAASASTLARFGKLRGCLNGSSSWDI